MRTAVQGLSDLNPIVAAKQAFQSHISLLGRARVLVGDAVSFGGNVKHELSEQRFLRLRGRSLELIRNFFDQARSHIGSLPRLLAYLLGRTIQLARNLVQA